MVPTHKKHTLFQQGTKGLVMEMELQVKALAAKAAVQNFHLQSQTVECTATSFPLTFTQPCHVLHTYNIKYKFFLKETKTALPANSLVTDNDGLEMLP